MTDYQRGYAYGKTHIREFGLKSAVSHSDSLRQDNGRLDMYTIGFRTAVSVHMERMMD